MLIGAIIGFMISTLWSLISIGCAYTQADKYNDTLQAHLYGKQKITIRWHMTILKALVLTSAGSVIGFFVTGPHYINMV